MNEKYPCDDVSSIVLFLVVLGCFCWLLSVTGCGNPSGLQSSTDREIGAIKEQQRQIDVEIGRAGAKIGATEKSIERAAGAISSSQERAAAMQEGLSECEAILKECQELAGRNAKIIDELGEQTGSRTQTAGN